MKFFDTPYFFIILAGLVVLCPTIYILCISISKVDPEYWKNKAEEELKLGNDLIENNDLNMLYEARDEQEKIVESFSARKKQAREDIVQLHQEIDAIKNSLCQTFSSTLDIRDWANVDLLIFYFETGRADTLKEALYQLDRQRQNEKLIDAIYSATESLASSIKLSISRLGDNINTSIEKLNNNISKQEQLALETQKLSNQQLKQLNSKVDVSNSLLKTNS